jgi:AraC family transcriptional regulator of arabinose operon
MRPETPCPHYRLLTTGLFHEGPAYSAYRHLGTDDWLLILTLGGSGRFGPDGDQFSSSAGDIVLIKPGVRHDYGTSASAGHWDLLWSHFHARAHWLEWLDWPVENGQLMRLQAEGQALEAFVGHLQACHALASGALRRNEELAMNALERALLAADAFNPHSSQPGVDARIRQVMDFACRNLSRRLSLDVLAEVGGLSLSRFAHLFRQQTGTTPQQFVEQQRIAQARQLLELSSRSIKQISNDLGFDTQFYFSQRFRKHAGLSPREYRRRAQQSL